MTNTVILSSLGAIQDYLGSSQAEEIDTLAIDWLDLDNEEIQKALHTLLLGQSEQLYGKRWSSIEIRKCRGQFTPMLIRWVLEASVTLPIQTLTLVSIVDNDVALALQQSLSGHFPATFDAGDIRQREIKPTGALPNIAKLEIWGSALSPFSIDLILRGIFEHAALLPSGSSSSTADYLGPIHALGLINCNFLPDSIDSIAKALGDYSPNTTKGCLHRHALQRLNLFSCRIGDNEVAILVNALHQFKHPLKHLNLGKNQCHRASFQALGDWLASPGCQLESLNLSLQQLGFGVQYWNPQPILDSLIPKSSVNDDDQKHTPSLKALYLHGNPIGCGENASAGTLMISPSSSPSFANSLVNVLTQNTNLEMVMLTDCYLSNESYDVLLRHLHQFRGIRKLWLDGIQRYKKAQSTKGFTSKITEGLLGPQNQNITLEEIHLPFRLTDLVLEIGTFMDRNFGGRRLLPHEESTNTIPCTLWPVVLGRINQTNLPKRLFSDIGNRAKRDLVRRANILYGMIRENAALQHAIGR